MELRLGTGVIRLPVLPAILTWGTNMTTHTHFDEQERISTSMSTLLALALVAALAFWLVLLPY